MTTLSSGAMSTASMVGARLERLPLSRWHIKARVIVGAVTFFDGFDQLMIAYSLPVLGPKWDLTPTSISWVIAVGGIGMLVGALGGGWLADRVGRLHVIAGALVVYAIMSLAMGMVDSLALFMIFRFIQGVGLGAEVPVAASYIGEITKANGRGRFVLMYEVIFPIGLVFSAIVSSWVVPHWGYEVLFMLGALPVLLVPIIWRLPESPRWLLSRGRFDEAERSMQRIEDAVRAHLGPDLPEPEVLSNEAQVEGQATFADLFRGKYLRRTLMLCTAWLTAYFVNYGIAAWLPTLFTRIFEVSVGTALHYSIITSVAGLIGCIIIALAIDGRGRRICLTTGLALTSVTLFLLSGFGTGSAVSVLWWSAGAAMFIFSVNMALYVYTAELYPTRMRAMGCAIGGASGRLGIVLGPLVVGQILQRSGGSLTAVFVAFGAVALVGAVTVGIFAVETKQKTLEEING